MNIENAQQQVDNWIKEHGVRYFNELTNMAQLTEEVGEVARIIARRYGEQSEKESDKNKDLGEELADVLFVVLCLAAPHRPHRNNHFWYKTNSSLPKDFVQFRRKCASYFIYILKFEDCSICQRVYPKSV